MDWNIGFPRQCQGVIVQEILDETLLYDPKSSSAISLNGSATKVWTLCNGKRRASDIAMELATELGVESELLADDVVVALDELHRHGLVEMSSSADHDR